MHIRTRLLAALALGPAAVLALPPASAPAAPPDPAAAFPATEDLSAQLLAVQRATARYHYVGFAEEDGYRRVSECPPGMGYHFARSSIAEGQEDLEITEPDILVYAPQRNGELRLVAVEYASATPATLFGQPFDPPHDPVPYYTLHVWVWEENPNGMFAAASPHVHCEFGRE